MQNTRDILVDHWRSCNKATGNLPPSVDSIEPLWQHPQPVPAVTLSTRESPSPNMESTNAAGLTLSAAAEVILYPQIGVTTIASNTSGSSRLVSHSQPASTQVPNSGNVAASDIHPDHLAALSSLCRCNVLSTSTDQTRKRHLLFSCPNTVLGPERMWKCPHCHHLTSRRDNVNKHIKSCKGHPKDVTELRIQPGEVWKCPLCAVKDPTKEMVVNHITLVHPGFRVRRRN